MRTRNLTLDICDYNNKVLCNLYDNKSDISGQATDVVITYERNGWKELSFKLPSTCYGEEGEERNYRLDYLIADYRIRAVDDYETDWYLISEPKITHSAFSTNVEVKAGHIAQLLKTRNLDLEFSDEEGNNVGTAEDLLFAILDGTDWTVGDVPAFLDYDGTPKKRSLEAAAKTGAFKMIEDMCDLFEAVPVFHGDSKTIDILPMNPFSKEISYDEQGKMIVGKLINYETGTIPYNAIKNRQVIELHYDRNMFNISRVTNTENIVTKLFAYGIFGDATTGYCSIQTCKHNEYILRVQATAGDEIRFEANDTVMYFIVEDDTLSSDDLIWSDLDFASRSYVWNNTQRKAYHIYKSPKTRNWVTVVPERELVKNFFPFLLNFDYYDRIGLFTDNMLQEIAAYQRDMSGLYDQSETAATAFNDEVSELSKIAQSNTGFLKLDIDSYSTDDTDSEHMGLAKLRIKKTETYPSGVIYRSDYYESRKNYFQWYVASELKANGLPVSGIGSIMIIVHDTTPVTWEKVYVKTIWDDNDHVYEDSEGTAGKYSYKEHSDDPAALTLWINKSVLGAKKAGDRYYLFCTDSMSGRLGELTAEDETTTNSINEQTKEAVQEGTVDHIITFDTKNADSVPVGICSTNYGWYYKYFKDEIREGELYLCWGEKGDTTWHRVYVSEDMPDVVNDAYYLSRKDARFYRGISDNWVEYEEVAERRCARGTAVVYHSAIRRDMLYHGYREKYIHESNTTIQAGNYAFKNEYDFYYVFTTYNDTSLIEEKHKLILDVINGYVWPDDDVDHITTFSTRTYDAITFPKENDLESIEYSKGKLNDSGTFVTSNDTYVSNFISVYSSVMYEYAIPSSTAYFYKQNKKYISSTELGTSGTFKTPEEAKYVRFVSSTQPVSSDYLRVENYDKCIYLSDKMYTILDNEGSGETIGINNLMKKFADTADNAYFVLLNNLTAAQNVIKTRTNNITMLLGDILRESMWQDDKYVEGDEIKLYTDAMDNLQEIGEPEYTYDFTFLDLYGSNKDQGYSIEENEPEWPDIHITDAIHLTDPDLGENRWAYIDKLEKCFDQEWKTKIEADTKLSLIGQHSFTDLLTRIAEVSNHTKANQSIYKRAGALNASGTLAAEKLEGMLDTARNSILGGASSWYTDDRGRIVLESSDGKSAMMLSGSGVLISNSRNSSGEWAWKSAITGDGLGADQVAAAFVSAKEALFGTITADMISAAAGSELEIASNNALTLYATADGTRPSGALTTDDSVIEIAARNGTTPAHINIGTGGELNIQAGAEGDVGGNMYIGSTGKLIMQANSEMQILSNGVLNIQGGKIDIQSGSTFMIDSENFKVYENGNVELTGMITSESGNIAGFTLDKTDTVKYLYAGETNSLSSTKHGVYIGTDGINVGGGILVVSADGSTTKFKTSANDIYLGNVTLSSTLSTMDSNTQDAQNAASAAASAASAAQATANSAVSAAAAAQSTADSAVSTVSTKSETFRCTAAQIITKAYRVGDTWIDTGSSYAWTYTCKQVSSTRTTNDWTLVSTAIAEGASFSVNTTTGEINIVANKSIKMASAGTIEIASGKKISLTTKGTIEIGNGGKPFTVGSNGTNAYIYNGRTSISDTTNSGIYVGTDGINIGKASGSYVKATADGTVDVSGILRASTLYIGGKQASISLDNSGHITLGSLDSSVSTAVTQASNATNKLANIEVDSSSGKIKLSAAYFDNLGTTTSGIYIEPNKIVARSGGTIDFSAAGTLSLKAGSVALTALSSTSLSNYNFDSLGSGTGIVITPTKIKAGSTGDIDFSAAKSLSLKANSVNISALSTLNLSSYSFDHLGTKSGTSATGIYISPTEIKANSNGTIDFSATSNIYFKSGAISLTAVNGLNDALGNKYTIQSGIDITASGIDLYGSNYIRIRTGTSSSATNNLIIDKNGIDMKTAGKFYLHASDASSSAILFGTDKSTATFHVGESGDVVCNSIVAKTATFGGLNMPGLVVSASKPTTHNTVWLIANSTKERQWSLLPSTYNLNEGTVGSWYYRDYQFAYTSDQYISGDRLHYGVSATLYVWDLDGRQAISFEAYLKNGDNWILLGKVENQQCHEGASIIINTLAYEDMTDLSANVMSPGVSGNFTLRFRASKSALYVRLMRDQSLLFKASSSNVEGEIPCSVYYIP